MRDKMTIKEVLALTGLENTMWTREYAGKLAMIHNFVSKERVVSASAELSIVEIALEKPKWNEITKKAKHVAHKFLVVTRYGNYSYSVPVGSKFGEMVMNDLKIAV